MGARGERRGFQVVVRARAGSTISVQVPRPAGLGIVRVFSEANVDVKAPSGGRPRSNTGLWPDVLVPTGRVRATGATQVFWVDVDVPADATPGNHPLAVSVSAGSLRRRLTTSALIVGATPTPVLQSLVGIWDNSSVTVSLARALAAYRLRSSEWSQDDNQLRQLMRYQSVVQMPGQTHPGAQQRSLSSAMAQLRRLGVAKRNVAYVADEPGCGSLASVESKARAARRADSGIRPLVTVAPNACGGAAARVLRDVRVFVPTERNATAAWSKKVTQWIYPNNANAGDGFTTFAIDDPGPANLLVAWRAAVLGAKGVLYWSADVWTRGSNPYRQTLARGTGQQYNGDGSLYYPDGRMSLRLALFREGANDYDLAACAGSRGVRIARGIAPQSRSFSHNVAAILRARAALANACAAR